MASRTVSSSASTTPGPRPPPRPWLGDWAVPREHGPPPTLGSASVNAHPSPPADLTWTDPCSHLDPRPDPDPSPLPPRLINKLQPGSVQKVNEPVQNWHKVRGPWKGLGAPLGDGRGSGSWRRPGVLGSELSCAQLENIGNFLRAITRYGVKPHDIFEANDLFENTNHTQVQSTLIALASQVTLRGRDGAWGAAGGPRAVMEGPHVPLEDTNHTWVQPSPITRAHWVMGPNGAKPGAQGALGGPKGDGAVPGELGINRGLGAPAGQGPVRTPSPRVSRRPRRRGTTWVWE